MDVVDRCDGGKAGYDVTLSPAAAGQPTEPYPVGSMEGRHTRLPATTTRHFDAVCVCSGLHEAPYVPPIPGLDGFTGAGGVVHSCAYKDKSIFKGRRVLVVGCGETGMDLGARALPPPTPEALTWFRAPHTKNFTCSFTPQTSPARSHLKLHVLIAPS